MSGRFGRIAVGIALGAAISGCSSVQLTAQNLAPGEYALVKVQTTQDGHPMLCAGGGFAGSVEIHGSETDADLVWLTRLDGSRQKLVWPAGFRARFTPRLEIVDAAGAVFAREGDHPSGGCPMPPGGTLIQGMDPPSTSAP